MKTQASLESNCLYVNRQLLVLTVIPTKSSHLLYVLPLSSTKGAFFSGYTVSKHLIGFMLDLKEHWSH